MSGTHYHVILMILAIVGMAAVLSYLAYVYLDARNAGPDYVYEAIKLGAQLSITITCDLQSGTWEASYDGRVTTCHESAMCALECAVASRERLASR